MADNKKSYYAIIPANVRYDKELTANAKLLYGEITALCNEKGYCWASNEYFASLYGVSKVSVQKWLKCLEDNGYIKRTVKRKEGSKEIEVRYITLVGGGHQEKLATPHQEKLADNNTVFNNTNEYNVLFEKIWKLYPNKKGKGRVSTTQKKKLHKVGYDTLKKCIERYKSELEKDKDWRKPQNGSTFFNSGYVDYLDENYEPSKQTAKPSSNKFNDFEQRNYSKEDMDDLEKKLLNKGR